MHAYDSWLTKCEDRAAARYHADVQWKLSRQQAATAQAASLFKADSTSWMASVTPIGTAANMLGSVQSMVSKVAQMHQVPANMVIVLAVLNWGAPSLVTSDAMKAQSQVLAAMVNHHNEEEGTAAGIILTPSHSYTRGSLYKLMENAHSLLSNCRVNFDVSFCLPFNQRTDERDQRAMVRHGKVALPIDDKPFASAWALWKNSQGLSKGLLNAVPLPASKDLVVVEDTADDALPATTSVTHQATNPAEKVMQIGVAGMSSILQGFLQGMPSLQGRAAPVVVVDLCAHVGEMCKAALQEKFAPILANPMYYLGFHANQLEVAQG